MSSVSDIKDQLKIILGAVTGIEQAFDYMPRYLGKKPLIGIYYDGATFESAEVGSHWAHYRITITTFIYMFNEKSIQETQESLGELLLSALRVKPSLNSTCLIHSIEELKNSFIELGNGNVYAMIEITLIADVEEDD